MASTGGSDNGDSDDQTTTKAGASTLGDVGGKGKGKKKKKNKRKKKK